MAEQQVVGQAAAANLLGSEMNRRGVGIVCGVTAVALSAFVLVFHPSRPLYASARSIEIVAADGTVLAAYPQNWGNDAESTLHILAADAAAALDRLRQEASVDPTRVGFFGASQAGWIIPLAVELLDSPPRFHVIISGAAVSTGAEEFYSALTGDGHRPPQLADASEIRDRVNAFPGPAGFDPARLLSASRVPTLWLLGERDESVPTFATVRVLDSIRAAGNLSRHALIRQLREGGRCFSR